MKHSTIRIKIPFIIALISMTSSLFLCRYHYTRAFHLFSLDKQMVRLLYQSNQKLRSHLAYTLPSHSSVTVYPFLRSVTAVYTFDIII